MTTHYLPARAPATGSTAGTDAAAPAPATLWRGRVMLIVGIVLLAVTLRYPVTGLFPLLPLVREAIGLDIAAASFLGMLPTLSLAWPASSLPL